MVLIDFVSRSLSMSLAVEVHARGGAVDKVLVWNNWDQHQEQYMYPTVLMEDLSNFNLKLIFWRTLIGQFEGAVTEVVDQD